MYGESTTVPKSHRGQRRPRGWMNDRPEESVGIPDTSVNFERVETFVRFNHSFKLSFDFRNKIALIFLRDEITHRLLEKNIKHKG